MQVVEQSAGRRRTPNASRARVRDWIREASGVRRLPALFMLNSCFAGSVSIFGSPERLFFEKAKQTQ